jgi:hypothetical protein
VRKYTPESYSGSARGDATVFSRLASPLIRESRNRQPREVRFRALLAEVDAGVLYERKGPAGSMKP